MAVTAALIGGGAALGSGLLGMFRPQDKAAAAQAEISRQQLDLARENLTAQMANQGLANQRAVAGTSDSFGTTVRYDPVTNTWVTQEGALPQAADRSALQATILRNTKDMQDQELLNELAMRRAGMAQPIADTALRQLQNFRPQSYDELAGLLTQQGITAARATYDPLRNDVLRSVARTGSAAGPVLAELGRSEAQNLRNTLQQSLIDSLTQTTNINNARRQGLESAATTASGLATPQIGQTPIQGSNINLTTNQGTGTRAGQAAYTTASSAYGPNTATGAATAAGQLAAKYPGDATSGIDRAVSGLKDLSTSFNQGGAGYNLLQSLFKNPSSSGSWDTSVGSTLGGGDYQWGMTTPADNWS
jgi:hypothetical protein